MGKRKTTNRNNTKNHMSTVILLVFAYSARGPIQGRKFYQKQLSEKKKKEQELPGSHQPVVNSELSLYPI